MQQNCTLCLKVFTPIRKSALYCSNDCRRLQAVKQYTYKSAYPEGLSTGTAGAISELAASIDLMLKGYEVFRAVSPACSADLVANKDGVFSSYEVRTGYRNGGGGVTFSRQNIRATKVIVVIPHEDKPSEIIYFDSDNVSTRHL